MTVSSTTSKVSYAGNGSTTVFSVPFYFLDNTHLKVVYRAADGTETVKTLTTDYTVTGAGVLSGGSVTMLVAPASGISVVIARNVPQTQEVDYITNDPFPAETHEKALDKLTMEVQQLQDAINRSIKLSITNTMTSTEFTIGAALRANKIFAFDAAGEFAVTQEIGTYKGNWSSGSAYAQRDLIKDTSNANIYICVVAHTSSGAQPISTNTDAAKWALLVDAASATSAQTAAAASATAAAGSATAANTSKVNAATSETNAAGSATAAANSATAANTSKVNAATSETNAGNSATAAAASAAAAAASAASGLYRQVLDKSANYTIVAADQGTLFRANTGSGAIAFTLPAISTVTDGFKISIVKWTSDANVVNINRSGSDTINGATTVQIGSQYSQVTLVADFETSTWFAAQSGLGSTNANVDTFSGNGSTTAFTLTAGPGSKNNTDIYVGGVHQDHGNYSISGTTLTFTTAPPTGTNNIEVVYSTPVPIGTPSDLTVTTAKLDDQVFAGLTAVTPAGTDYVAIASTANSSNKRKALVSDIVALAQPFATGTLMLFQQTAAPTGWTKQTTHNDKALRVVSGTASSGGTVAFTTAFAASLSAGATTLSTTQIPSHDHANGFGLNYGVKNWVRDNCGGTGYDQGSQTSFSGGGGSHTHTLPSFAVQYVDLIIASKN